MRAELETYTFNPYRFHIEFDTGGSTGEDINVFVASQLPPSKEGLRRLTKVEEMVNALHQSDPYQAELEAIDQWQKNTTSEMMHEHGKQMGLVSKEGFGEETGARKRVLKKTLKANRKAAVREYERQLHALRDTLRKLPLEQYDLGKLGQIIRDYSEARFIRCFYYQLPTGFCPWFVA
jgi:hypothetical protein